MAYFSPQNWTTAGRPRTTKIFLHALFWIVLIFTLISQFPLGTVNAGERGVRLRFGAVTGEVLGEGLYIRMPFVERIVKMDVRVQKEQVKADAASKDLQTVRSDVALNYRIEPSQVARVYQELGRDYNANLIAPALQEAVKASTARFTAEELITKREEVREEVKTILREKLNRRGIVIDEFAIVNFDFSQAFNEAIESKVTAEQNALAARNKLEQIKFEAEQEIAKAKGRAEAITIESEALRDNPQLLELRKIEKWDGKLPQVTGEASPLINIR